MHGAQQWCMPVPCVRACVSVYHSLNTDRATTHHVFLTHLQQNCNLGHWTFKLLDVTSKGSGEEKHYLLLIITSSASVKPVFASLSPFYSTCCFFLIILFSLFFLNGCTLYYIFYFIEYYIYIYIYIERETDREREMFLLFQACFAHWNHKETINNLIWSHILMLSMSTEK